MNAVVSRLGDPEEAFWLTRSVARVIGLDLSAAMRSGALGPQEYSDMVTRCRLCQDFGACRNWLASRGPRGAGVVPPTCANAARLNDLARRLR